MSSDEAPLHEDRDASPEVVRQRVFSSKELFAGERVVWIEHAGEQYRLLLTRNDRLVLQK